MPEALTEHPHLRQVDGEGHRRWFWSNGLELIVWLESAEAEAPITGFQLCHGPEHAQHSVVWKRGARVVYERIDDGESRSGRAKQSPISVATGAPDLPRLREDFLQRAEGLDDRIVDCVRTCLDAVIAES